MNVFVYIYEGVKAICKLIFDFVKYFFVGLFSFIPMFFKIPKELNKDKKIHYNKEKDALLAEYKKEEKRRLKEEEKKRKQFVENETKRQLLEEKQIRKKVKIKDNTKRRRNINDEKDAGEKLDKFGNEVISFSDKLKKLFTFQIGGKKDKYADMPEMVINYNGPDATKSLEKKTYEYVIRTPENKIVKDYFAAFSKVEVHSYLKSQGNIVYSIRTSKWINGMYGNRGGTHDKFKTKDLIFFLTQLSTYLKVGIPLADAVKILAKQFKNKKYKRILNALVYDLSTGRNFSEALEKRGKAFPNILINMVKTSEMTGELPETLDDMEEYFTELESTRKAMVTAMMYPAIIFIIAIGVGTFIMLYVVPKFIEIYETMDNAEIPWITKAVLSFSNFLQNYIIYMGFGFIIILIIFIYLFKNVKTFKRAVQNIIMHLPVFANVVIYNEVTTFTKTFASLLSHNVFITDSMEILNQVTNNEIYKELITEAINNIAKGVSVSDAFKDKWCFPLPAYEMIVTGEKTGQLPEMMHKVSLYYQDLHKNSVARIKTFVEPALIIMLTVMVGVIVLAIVVPMFSMYSQIQT